MKVFSLLINLIKLVISEIISEMIVFNKTQFLGWNEFNNFCCKDTINFAINCK